MKKFLCMALGLLLLGCGQGTAPRATPIKHSARYQVSRADGPGPLFLIGGGDDTPPLLRHFVELAGGADAPLVIVPFAGGDAQGDMARAAFSAQGATNITVLSGHAEQLQADRASLGAAAGVYFAGGSPDRLLARFAPYADAARTAWQGGAVIGGSSAGAMVWGNRVIIKGETPDALARGAAGLGVADGLAFLNNTIVDPHFGVRGRFTRLWLASGGENALGIGIDEQTAAYLPAQGPLEASGAGAVTLIRPEGAAGMPARVTVVPAGHKIDLKDWRLDQAR